VKTYVPVTPSPGGILHAGRAETGVTALPGSTCTADGSAMTVTEDGDLIRRSDRYYGEGAPDTAWWARIASWPDYDQIITGYDWAGVLSEHLQKDAIAILDCGCGMGYFPRRLGSQVALPPGMALHYDTLDVSSRSLAEHRRGLRLPFVPRHSFSSAIENFHDVPWAGSYELIWCMHSLYTVPPQRLPRVITTLASLLAPDGRCFIYLPRRHSAYMVLFGLYQELDPGGQRQSYLTAEDVLAELAASGQARSVEVTDCSFDHWVEGEQLLAAYLNQVCLCPDQLTLAQWRQSAAIGRYLDAAFDRGRAAWRFGQDLSLISFARC
jgi:SAM-dependent methyltransferase